MFKVKGAIDYKEDLRVEQVRTFEELDKYADEWDLLALNAPQQHPVLSHAWISAYLKTSLKEGESWFCLFAFDNNDLVGVLPLISRESRFLGKKCLLLSTPRHSHTNWVDFLFKGKYGKRVIQLFADYLNAMRPKVVRLSMDQVISDSPTFSILGEGICGIYSFSFTNGYASIIPVEGSFIDYRNRLSKKLTRNLRRSYNILTKLGDYSVTVISDRSGMLENLRSFANIEQSGWKDKEGATIVNKFWKLFEEQVQNMGRRGWLEWYFLEIENKKIAGYLIIPFGRSAIIYKTAYDEEYHSLSPGSVLTEKMIEQIFSTGKYESINFLADYEWLLRWNVELKPYYKIVFAFNNPLSFFSTRVLYTIYLKFPLIQRLRKYLYRNIMNIRKK